MTIRQLELRINEADLGRWAAGALERARVANGGNPKGFRLGDIRLREGHVAVTGETALDFHVTTRLVSGEMIFAAAVSDGRLALELTTVRGCFPVPEAAREMVVKKLAALDVFAGHAEAFGLRLLLRPGGLLPPGVAGGDFRVTRVQCRAEWLELHLAASSGAA